MSSTQCAESPSFDGRKAADHLTPTTRVGFTQYVKPDFVTPAGFPLTPADAGALLRDILLAFEPNTELYARGPRFLRGARLANPDLVQGAKARGVRADKLVGLHRS